MSNDFEKINSKDLDKLFATVYVQPDGLGLYQHVSENKWQQAERSHCFYSICLEKELT